MKIQDLYDNLSVPTWALPFLVNGDGSGLSNLDVDLISGWIAEFERHASKNGARAEFEFVVGDGEEYFSKFPAFGKPATCVDCSILYLTNWNQYSTLTTMQPYRKKAALPFSPVKGPTETVYIRTRNGNTLSMFFNKDTGLLVIDLTSKDESGGNELVRRTLDESKLLGHCK